jgi:hypothetical protein
MRLISLNDTTLFDGIETYRPDSLEHSLYLHTRMWPLADVVVPRAGLVLFDTGDALYFDIAFFGPQSFVDVETARLGEGTKVVVFSSREQTEFVVMTPDDEIVQVISRGPRIDDDVITQDKATLMLSAAHKVDDGHWLHFDDDDFDGEFTGAMRIESFDGVTLTLPLEISDRYADHDMLPMRTLETGNGRLCDQRSAHSGTVAIHQRVDHPGQAVDIGLQVFPQPNGNMFGIPGLPTPQQIADLRASGLLFDPFNMPYPDDVGRRSRRAPRSRRKRRRRVAKGAHRDRISRIKASFG